MKTVVYMDSDRIRACGFFPSFSKLRSDLEWEVPERAFKFLLVDDTLVIGAVLDHSEVFALYMTRDETGDNTRMKAKAVAKGAYDQRYYGWVSAAGQIDQDGQITKWKSECFRVDTPHNMRDEIEREVTRLFLAGTLTP